MGFLKRLFGLGAVAEAIEADGVEKQEKYYVLELERIAIQTAVGYLASAVSQCDFRTYWGYEEVERDEFYLWNYAPNPDQSSTQFLWDLVETLLYNGEALVVEAHGSLFLADSYGIEERGTRERKFLGILVNGEGLADRPASEVLYFKMDNTNIHSLLSQVCLQYEELIQDAAEGYKKACVDKGILNIEARAMGSNDYDKIRSDLLNRRFKDFFGAKSAVLPLYSGYNYTPHTRPMRNTSEIGDIKTISDEIYNRVGQILRVPPSMLRGEIGNAGETTENFIRFGVRPLCNLLQEEITRKRYGRDGFRKGNYLTVDTFAVELSGVIGMAEKVDKLIGCGVYSVNEIRKKIWEPILKEEEANRHYITKNYGKMKEGKEDE